MALLKIYAIQSLLDSVLVCVSVYGSSLNAWTMDTIYTERVVSVLEVASHRGTTWILYNFIAQGAIYIY